MACGSGLRRLQQGRPVAVSLPARQSGFRRPCGTGFQCEACGSKPPAGRRDSSDPANGLLPQAICDSLLPIRSVGL